MAKLVSIRWPTLSNCRLQNSLPFSRDTVRDAILGNRRYKFIASLPNPTRNFTLVPDPSAAFSPTLSRENTDCFAVYSNCSFSVKPLLFTVLNRFCSCFVFSVSFQQSFGQELVITPGCEQSLSFPIRPYNDTIFFSSFFLDSRTIIYSRKSLINRCEL